MVKLSPLGNVLPVTRKKAQAVVDALDAAGVTFRTCWGYNTIPDHNNRRCVDFMVTDSRPKGRRAGDALAAYLIDHADALGLNWLIWDRRIYRHQNTTRGHGWAAYTGADPHTSHVHAEFDALPLGKLGKAAQNRAVITKSPWRGTLYVIRGPVMAYDGTGRQRPEHRLDTGAKITGAVDRDPFGDGRYFRRGKKPHRLWYPLDSGNWSHSRNGAPIKAPRRRK